MIDNFFQLFIREILTGIIRDAVAEFIKGNLHFRTAFFRVEIFPFPAGGISGDNGKISFQAFGMIRGDGLPCRKISIIFAFFGILGISDNIPDDVLNESAVMVTAFGEGRFRTREIEFNYFRIFHDRIPPFLVLTALFPVWCGGRFGM